MASRQNRQKAQRRAIQAQRLIDAQRGVRQAMNRAIKAASKRMKNGMNAAQQGVELCQESKWALKFKLLYFLLVLCSSVSIFAGWVPTEDLPFDTSVKAVIAVPLLLYAIPLVACFASSYIYHMAWCFILIFWPRWIIAFLVREMSVHDYVSQNPAVKLYTLENGDNILICTKDGLLLWMGYLNVIINAYRSNKSWCGSFSEQHLKMIGGRCRIVKSHTAPASFGNLLLDLSTLAALLIPFYTDVNGIAELYVQELYNSMINPPVTETSSKSEQESFIKYLAEHLALCSARHMRLLFTYICRFFNSLGPGRKSQFLAAVNKIKISGAWREKAKCHPLLAKVLFFDRDNAANTDYKYGKKARHLFRFMRNFYEHGGDCDFFTKLQQVMNMEDLDHIGVDLFSSFVVQISFEIHMRPNMADVLDYAWKLYGV